MGALDVTEILTSLIEVLMIFINVLPIYVISFYKVPREKSTIDELIFILSCGTVSLILFSMPFALIPYSNDAREVFTLTCNMYQCAVVWFQVFSAFLISVMCVFVTYQGFYLMRRKESYRNQTWSRKVTSVIVILICLSCFGISFTPLIYSRVSSSYVFVNGTMDENISSCHIYPEVKSVVTNLNTIALYIYLLIGLLNFTCVMACMCMTSQLRSKIKLQILLRVSHQENELLVDSDFLVISYLGTTRLVQALGAFFYFFWIPNLYLLIGLLNFTCVMACMCMTSHLRSKIVDSDFLVISYLGTTRLVQALGAFFYFFWIPNLVMLGLVSAGLSISDKAIGYAMLGTVMTGLINPLVYAFFDKSYRRGYSRALRKILLFCRCRKTSNIVTETQMVTAVPEVSTDKHHAESYINEQCLLDGEMDDTETYEIMNNIPDSDVYNTDEDADVEDMEHDDVKSNNCPELQEFSYQNGDDTNFLKSGEDSPESDTSYSKQMVVYLSGTGDHEYDKLLEDEDDLMIEDPSTGL